MCEPAAGAIQSELSSDGENEFVTSSPTHTTSQETQFLSKCPPPIDEYEKEICHPLPFGTLVFENSPFYTNSYPLHNYNYYRSLLSPTDSKLELINSDYSVINIEPSHNTQLNIDCTVR